VAETARATNAVQVGLGALGEVEVDHHVHGLDINTTGKQIRAHQVSGGAVAELVEHAVSVWLLHLSMDVEATVAQLGDLLGQQLNAVHRVTEDNTLVDVELGEEGVEAVYFLLFLNKGVVLGNTAQSEFVHQVDDVCIGHELVLERLDGHREGGREQADLSVGLALANEGLEHLLELGAEQLVGLVHDNDLALGQVGDALLGQVVDAAGGCDHHMHRGVEANNIIAEIGATSTGHDLDLHVFADFHHDGGSLQRQLSCRNQHKYCENVKNRERIEKMNVRRRIRIYLEWIVKKLPWIALVVASTFSRQGIINAAVLPVPFFARARTSLPARMIGIASS
jgi:hypothetical protein